MKEKTKYDLILDALQELLESNTIQNISVNDIAQTAGIGKGSIYYYFPSKEAILDALVERSYQRPLEIAGTLAQQTDIDPYTRMAMLFQACRTSSIEFLRHDSLIANTDRKVYTFIHHKYVNYLITSLKPTLTALIQQSIDNGDSRSSSPAALAEIVLIILVVKLDNTLVPSTPEEIRDTFRVLIELLGDGAGNPEGVFNYLMI
ncbi:MAG: TetR/AcrR family transcriptional regulator [Lachnospiraceae bacterium]|nr:TetR/AcrR family transcriptional regulator [Lachnospiraceae bacterium]